MSDGYSSPFPRREPLTVPYIEGLHAAAEAQRRRKAHQRSGQCDGCPSCETEAEARKEARDD